jgi:FtsP/CotA-like multicopper oxidase with cupredoxin domain
MMNIQNLKRIHMNTQTSNPRRTSLAAAALLLLASPGISLAAAHLVDGLHGDPGTPTFNLVAAAGYLSTPEGNSLYFWGYGTNAGASAKPQYSGPTLIVNQGDVVTVRLKNKLPVYTSLVFPGQSGVTATFVPGVGSSQSGLLTVEPSPASLTGANGGEVGYTFTAGQPGTYMYHSGTRPDLQIEMGLVGALIVRPAGFDASVTTSRRAYGDAASEFDHEYLFLLSDMDDKIHDAVEKQVQAATSVPVGELLITVDMSKRFAVYWFMNGRCGPDTMMPTNHPSLPAQPYDCFPLFHPGEKVVMRVIGGGSDEHPLHHHGNHARMIAQDGRLLNSPGGWGADLGNLEFTVPSTPGSTIDTMFSWTGAGLGWDAYGHPAGSPSTPYHPATNPDGLRPYEDPNDHGKPFPVILPPAQHIVDGMMYGGSPFLGSPGLQKPGEGGFNNNNGFMYLWHSHAEKEIVNNDIFPGGMMTFALVEAWP